MTKHAAWLFFLAACTLGCKTTWTPPPARPTPAKPVAKTICPERVTQELPEPTWQASPGPTLPPKTFVEPVVAAKPKQEVAIPVLPELTTAQATTTSEMAKEEKAVAPSPAAVTLPPAPPMQQDISRQVFYGAASILGTLFTCILAPLVVDCLRLRLGISRPTPPASRT